MRLSLLNFGLPLLTRELTELAARRRTYVLRTVYTIILYSIASCSYFAWIGQFRPESFEILGQGKPMFFQLVRWQFWGVYLVLPLLTCGAISNEKESQTLQLLRLTKLGGWTILFEKLASRLIAMGTFLLLPLPLAAIAYSMGGIEVDDVVKSVYVLGVTALQIACFSLLCSTWFRTSTGAMLGAYLLGGFALNYGWGLVRLMLLALLHLGVFNLSLFNNPWPGMDDVGRDWVAATVMSKVDYQPLSGFWVFGFRTLDGDDVAPPRFLLTGQQGWFVDPDVTGTWGSARIWFNKLMTMNATVVADSTSDAVFRSIPILASALGFLSLARYFLWRRAETVGWHFLRSVFLALDGGFLRLSQNRSKLGVESPSVDVDLPVHRPIAWRETRRQMIGRMEHLGRFLILIEIPLIGCLAWNSFSSPTEFLQRLPMIWSILWTTAALIVVIVSTGLVPLERSRQSLDVILTSPMSADEIVIQKLSGLRRLIVVLCLPLLTLLGFQWFSTSVGAVDHTPQFEITNLRSDLVIENWHEQSKVEFALIRIGQAVAAPFYLLLLGWFGFQFGLRMKNQLRAVLAVSALDALVYLAPDVLSMVFSRLQMVFVRQIRWIPQLCEILSQWLSPRWILFPDSVRQPIINLPFVRTDVLPRIWFPLLFHFLIFGGMLWCVRRNALTQFSRYVHRTEPSSSKNLPLAQIEEIRVLDFEPGLNTRNDA